MPNSALGFGDFPRMRHLTGGPVTRHLGHHRSGLGSPRADLLEPLRAGRPPVRFSLQRQRVQRRGVDENALQPRHGSCCRFSQYSAPPSMSAFTASEINPWRWSRPLVKAMMSATREGDDAGCPVDAGPAACQRRSIGRRTGVRSRPLCRLRRRHLRFTAQKDDFVARRDLRHRRGEEPRELSGRDTLPVGLLNDDFGASLDGAAETIELCLRYAKRCRGDERGSPAPAHLYPEHHGDRGARSPA